MPVIFIRYSKFAFLIVKVLLVVIAGLEFSHSLFEVSEIYLKEAELFAHTMLLSLGSFYILLQADQRVLRQLIVSYLPNLDMLLREHDIGMMLIMTF